MNNAILIYIALLAFLLLTAFFFLLYAYKIIRRAPEGLKKAQLDLPDLKEIKEDNE